MIVSSQFSHQNSIRTVSDSIRTERAKPPPFWGRQCVRGTLGSSRHSRWALVGRMSQGYYDYELRLHRELLKSVMSAQPDPSPAMNNPYAGRSSCSKNISFGTNGAIDPIKYTEHSGKRGASTVFEEGGGPKAPHLPQVPGYFMGLAKHGGGPVPKLNEHMGKRANSDQMKHHLPFNAEAGGLEMAQWHQYGISSDGCPRRRAACRPRRRSSLARTCRSPTRSPSPHHPTPHSWASVRSLIRVPRARTLALGSSGAWRLHKNLIHHLRR